MFNSRIIGLCSALLAVFAVWMYQENPMLLGVSVDKNLPSGGDFTILTQQPSLDSTLNRFKDELGSDYVPYRNHCLRVLTFALFYYKLEHNGASPDQASVNLMAMAIAYHDIALWSDGLLDYLDPSVAAMEKDLAALGMALTPGDLETAKQIILQHHKWTEWTAPLASSDNENESEAMANGALVNAVRRGDWADATLGLIKGKLPPSYLEAAYTAIPEAGFHNVLVEMGPRLSPDSLWGQLKVLNILKW
mmetsp:Transcript_26769/g.61566  ORF Transcript_26769/g.61566 Transcript_26769/m.61566 type:complete len:249 (-) Transcript_26769:77-823(-)